MSASTCGRSVLPKSVTEYSVRGGTSGNSSRRIMPSVASCRSTCDSTFSDTDGMFRYSSLKRTGSLSEIFTRTTNATCCRAIRASGLPCNIRSLIFLPLPLTQNRLIASKTDFSVRGKPFGKLLLPLCQSPNFASRN